MYTWERIDTTQIDPRYPNRIMLPPRRRIKAIRFKVPPKTLSLWINGWRCGHFLMGEQLVFDGMKFKSCYVTFTIEVSDPRSLKCAELLTSSTNTSKYAKLATRCRLIKWRDDGNIQRTRVNTSPVQECEHQPGYILLVEHLGCLLPVLGDELRHQDDVVRYLKRKTNINLPDDVTLAIRDVNRMLFDIWKELGQTAHKHPLVQSLTGMY